MTTYEGSRNLSKLVEFAAGDGRLAEFVEIPSAGKITEDLQFWMQNVKVQIEAMLTSYKRGTALLLVFGTSLGFAIALTCMGPNLGQSRSKKRRGKKNKRGAGVDAAGGLEVGSACNPGVDAAGGLDLLADQKKYHK